MTTDTYTPWQLARLADCADPDATDSPGARFLERVESDYREAVDEGRFDPDDTPHEIADSAVPVYTREMWLTFVDLAAYQEDPSELGYENDDMDKAGAVCLYIIADRLVRALADEEPDEDDDEDDDA